MCAATHAGELKTSFAKRTYTAESGLLALQIFQCNIRIVRNCARVVSGIQMPLLDLIATHREQEGVSSLSFAQICACDYGARAAPFGASSVCAVSKISALDAISTTAATTAYGTMLGPQRAIGTTLSSATVQLSM